MIYEGQFASRDGKLYTVKITSEAPGGRKPVTLGATPLTTQMRGDSGNIYAPVKCSGATVSIVTDGYLLDIYSPKAQGTKVEVSDEAGIVWTGYATPNLYDMGFSKPKEEISVECVDALSTLEHVKYFAPVRQIRSLAEILKTVIGECHAYNVIYVSAATRLPWSVQPFLDEVYISESCFFGEKEAGESDEDVAWSCKEVLEEICRFMGVTAIADGEAVWLIDYDAIKAGDPAYTVYSLDDEVHTVPATPEKTITGTDYAATGAKLSIGDVYNKVTVATDLTTFDSLMPEIFDDATLENITSSAQPTINVDKKRFGYISWIYQGKSGNLETLVDRGAVGRKANSWFFVASQYFRSPHITTYPQTATCGWDFVQQNYGCIVKKEFVKDISDTLADEAAAMTAQDYIKWASSEVSHLSFTNSIMCFVRGGAKPKYYAGSATDTVGSSYYDLHHRDDVMFTISAPGGARFFGGPHAYILISGNVVLSHNDNDAYDKGSFNFDQKKYRSTIRGKWEYIYARLECGGQYWNGDAWQSSPCDFRLYFDNADNKKTYECIYKGLPIRNTVRWWWGIDREGTAIPVPEGKLLTGEINFTLYSPMQQYDDAQVGSGQDDGRSYWLWLKDFAIQAVIGNPDYQDLKSDTAYTNVIDSSYVTEMDDITLRICSYDGKSPSYNAVAYKSLGEYHFVEATQNTALAAGEADWQGSGQGMRQEEHLIYRLVNQYSTPGLILELPLKGGLKPYGLIRDTVFSDLVFIIDSYSMDYRTNTQRVRLVEKK